jgi:hypothetical protein
VNSRIPALEAPSETQESLETVEDEAQRAAEPRFDAEEAEEAQEDVQRPWWRRVFGG